MTDLIDPDKWEEFQYLNDDGNVTPSFRFSRYFHDTCDNVTPKMVGIWLRYVDLDTIDFFMETLRRVDEKGRDDSVSENDETRQDMADLLYLTMLMWQWETGKKWKMDVNDVEAAHLNAEYMFRLAGLIQYEYLQRHGGKSKDNRLEDDEAQYHGKLTIFE